MKRVVRGLVVLLVAVLAVPTLGVGPAGAAPPGPPTLQTPVNGATNVTGNPVFTWSPAVGAVKYRFQVSTSSSFSNFLYNVETYNTAGTPPIDLPLGTIYWRVASIDPSNAVGAFSGTAQFTKVAAPAPVLTNPPNMATFDFPAQPVVFSWQAVAGAKRYVLEIDDDPAFLPPLVVPAISTNNTSYALTTPQAIGQTYYWRVRAYSLIDNASQDSEVRQYTTSWTSVPQLTFPPDTTEPPIEEVVFQWNAVAGAQNYDIQWSPDINFASNVSTRTVLGTRYSPPSALDNGSYFWRVRARNVSNGLSNWSSTRTFRRAWPANPGVGQTPAPQWSSSTAISLLTPSNGAVAVTLPHYSWTPQRLASRYEIWLSQDPNFSPGQYSSCTTNHTTITPAIDECSQLIPQPSPTYYWKVRAIDTTLNDTILGEFSPTFSFSYVPNLVSGALPTSGTTTLPVLHWNTPSDHIGRYRVFVSQSGGGTQTWDTYSTYFVPPNLETAKSYTWYVRTLDPLNRLGPVPGWVNSFTLDPPADVAGPTIPLNAPVSTGAGGIHAPLLSWTPITGAETYRIWQRKAGDLVWLLMDTGDLKTAGHAYTHDDLPPGNYQYWVEALDKDGVTIGASNNGTFTINGIPATTLTAPGHCPPLTACTAQPDTPTLTWDRVPGATKYVVTLANDPAFTTVFRTTNTIFPELTPTISLGDSQAGQAIYWYARPCYGVLCGPGPDTYGGTNPPLRAFRKQSPSVEPIFPADGATVDDQITFAWKDYLLTNQVPSAPGQLPSTQEAKLYRIKVSSAADFSNTIDEEVVDQTTYTAYDTTYPVGTTLYWRVNAIDQSGNELPPSVVRTVVRSAPSLSLLTPTAGQTVTGVPLFSWTPQPFAKTYEIEVYKNVDQPLTGANRVANQANLGQSAYTPTTALPAGTYGWRIRRYDATGKVGPWSANSNIELRTFTLAGTPASLISPVGGASVPNNAVLYQWAAVNGATQYRVEVSTTADFAVLYENPSVTTPMTAWAPTALYAEGTYFWRVKTLDGGNNVISTSGAETFTVNAPGGAFHPLTPFRVLDSRTTTGGFNGPVGQNASKTLTVADGTQIPLTASAVVLNVTATGGTQSSFLSLYPTGAPNPGTASLLFAAGQTVPNLVTVKLGSGGGNQGKVNIFNQLGSVHVIADVVGYYDNGSEPNGAFFNGVTPQRLLDSRSNIGGWAGQKLAAGELNTRTLQVAGVVPIPPTATGVVMNVTVAGGTSASYLSVYPAGAANPGTTNLLFAAGQTVPNLVVVGLGSGGANAGKVTFFNQLGNVHVIADVVGYFDPTGGDRFHPITPVRALDSRSNTGGWASQALGQNVQRTLAVSGAVPGVPASSKGVVANVTATGGTAASYLGLFPSGAPNPGTANLLFASGQTIPNAVYVKTGTGGGVEIYNQLGQVNVIMDIAGYFAAS